MHKNRIRDILEGRLTTLQRPILNEHLERLTQSYFNAFDADTIQNHIKTLENLLKEKTPQIQFQSNENGLTLTIITFDTPWLFTCLSGLLAIHHLEIQSAKIFTYSNDSQSNQSNYYLKQKKVIDVFKLQGDMQTKAFQEDLKKMLALLKKNKIEDARSKLYQQIEQYLSSLKKEEPLLLPIEVNIKPERGWLRIQLEGKDTPIFLFTITNALASQGIDLIAMDIQTNKGIIHDVIWMHDQYHRIKQDPEFLEKLKIALVLSKQFTTRLPHASNAPKAFHFFELYLSELLKKENPLSDLIFVKEENILTPLALLLGTGPYVWEQLIKWQHSSFLPFLKKMPRFQWHNNWKEHKNNLHEILSNCKTFEEKKEKLNLYKDEQLFNIDVMHLLYPHMSFSDFAEQLTRLAELILSTALKLCYEHMKPNQKIPYALCALGKFGGEELGYASDLELIFIYANEGREDASHNPFFNTLIKTLIHCINAKSHGIFELDFRLRPYGEKGTLSTSLAHWVSYLKDPEKSLPYEHQAILKLRPICGDKSLMKEIMIKRREILSTCNIPLYEKVEQMRQKQLKAMLNPSQVNAKYSKGALVDIEYNVQYLQCYYFKEYDYIDSPHTLIALGQLLEHKIISASSYEKLSNAYAFFRRLINSLRMVRGHAKDLLIPKASSNEYLYLCKRLHYQDTKEGTAQTQLQDEIIKHRANVSHFIEKQLIHQEEVHYEDMGLADLLLISNPEVKDTQKILQSYGFNNPELAYQTLKEMLAQSNNKHLLLSILLISSHLWPRSPDPDKVLIHLEDFFNQVDQDLIQNIFFNPNITQLLISIFGHSEHLSQLLCQHPDWIEFLFDLLDHDQIKSQTTLKHSFKKRLSSKDSFMTCIEKLVIYHKQELLCIGLRDIYKQVNLEQTIQEISELTDLIIDQVFVLILTNKNYLHLYKKQCIIAMGKLGGEELNYSSDIDLLFLLDNDLTEKDREQISAVNLDLIKILTEPRSLGSFFRVDMRLRPYGQSGPLQIPSSAYLKYYETEAQGWELQAWIKARSISGNITLGEGVIHQVQSICLEAKRQKNIFQNTDKLQKQQCLILERKNIIDKEVKEGKYGIRAIEFFTQRLQITYANSFPDLISGHTLKALSRLNAHRLIDQETYQTLHEAYLFMRRVEHRLQLLGFQQNHLIPTDEIELIKLAKRMGYTDTMETKALKAFLNDYHQLRRRIWEVTKKPPIPFPRG